MAFVSSDDILIMPPLPGFRFYYGGHPCQFGDLRLPEGTGPWPVVMNIHGGYWRAKYDLTHAGHLCAALATKGIATWNLEYRRVGDPGGGWPATFQDVVRGYRYLRPLAGRYSLDADNIVVMGHSAGGQLALCLAAHESSIKCAISLAGVVDLQSAWELHLSNDAAVEFLGGTPAEVPERYAEADPMQLSSGVPQWLITGSADTIVPPEMSQAYVELKAQRGEDVHLLETPEAGHFDLIDPRSAAWPGIEQTIISLAGRAKPL